ncbi:low molecular weight phosphatase family protein [Mycolicibacterium neoaurum]|nr:low molecular weight phosphatase family protein [Mycolicibacterium neoaurum]WBP97162.1 low molecular weight phosphatase family protein [Mycolicibacterium neoaurum]WBS10911.1 low molecular weight phosphatase family protein [Mycolicibacterium neoaurum]
MHVLFVCTGNICRSPTAERLMTSYAVAAGLNDVVATSAGTRAVIGHPIHTEAKRVLLRLGGDGEEFAARQLNARLAASADLILTMTRAHRNTVLEVAPQCLKRTYTVVEAARLVTELNARSVADLANLRPHLSTNDVADIADPIGQQPEVFAEIGDEIAAALRPLLELCRG